MYFHREEFSIIFKSEENFSDQNLWKIDRDTDMKLYIMRNLSESDRDHERIKYEWE